MKRSTSISIITLLHLVIVTFTACQPWYEREPLEIYYDGVAQVRIDVDWMNHLGERPELMTIMLTKDGDQFTDVRVTNEVDRAYYRLGEGTYNVMVFNYSYDDYSTMRFEDRDSYSRLTARSNDLRNYMNGEWDRGVVYMQNPGLIGVAVDTFTITKEDIESQRHFIDYRDREKPDTLSIVRRETVYDMTCNLNVYVRTTGLKYMKSLVGNVSGLADGFTLSSGHRTTEHGPILLNAWFKRTGTQMEMLDIFKRTRADEGNRADTTIVVNPDTLYQDDGQVHDWLCASVSTFGLPFGDEDPELRTPGTHLLTLCFTLLDGSKRTFVYDVSRYMRYRTNFIDGLSGSRGNDGRRSPRLQLDLDLIVDIPLDFPDLPYVPDPEEPSGPASGFDAIVDPWEENDPVDVYF